MINLLLLFIPFWTIAIVYLIVITGEEDND